MKHSWTGLKKRSAGVLRQSGLLGRAQEIGKGIVVYLIALVLVCLGVFSGSAARAQSDWNNWDGRDHRAGGATVADNSMTAEEKRAKIKRFSFVRDAIRFRLNQSFFDLGTESFEEILKTIGILDPKTQILQFGISNVDPRNQRKIKDNSWLQYKYFRSQIRLREGGMSVRIDTDISDAMIYKPAWNNTAWGGGVAAKCIIRMRGKVQMTVDAKFSDDQHVVISVPQMRNDTFRMQSSGCNSGVGETLTQWTISQFGPGQLQSGLQTMFNDLFNSEEGAASFAMADFAKELSAKGIYVNAPSMASATNVRSNFRVELGLLGFLHNTRGNLNVKIHNPRNNFVNQVGFEWMLNSGFAAHSRNVSGAPTVAARETRSGFAGWGVAPMRKNGERVDFDAAAALSEAYIGSLFNALFNSGFFNWQVRDKSIHQTYSINPLSKMALFAETLPNGTRLTSSNYQDARLEMQVLAPPTLGMQNDQTIVLTIPRFSLGYFAKANGLKGEASLLEFESKFRLRAKLNFTEDGTFRFDFSGEPVGDFEVLDRKNVAPHVTNAQLFEALNSEVSRILSSVEVDLPLLKGRKLDVAYLGIDGTAETGRTLSVYLKVSKHSEVENSQRRPMR